MEGFLKNRFRYKDEDGNKVYSINVPVVNRENGCVSFDEHFITKKLNMFDTQNPTYYLSNKNGWRTEILKQNNSYLLKIDNETKIKLSFENDKALFAYQNKEQDLISINTKTNQPNLYIYYPNGITNQVVEYSEFQNDSPNLRRELEKENGKYVNKKLDLTLNDGYRISSTFENDLEYRKEYRKDGTLKYLSTNKVIDHNDLSKNETLYYDFYIQNVNFPVLRNSDTKLELTDPKTKEKAIFHLSADKDKILDTEPKDKRKLSKITNNVLNSFLNNVDFLNDTMGQELPNAYLYANLDNSKIFTNFDIIKQPKTLKEFQDKFFDENDEVEFKVGLIANKAKNHSLCLIIPNPKKFPKEKAILLDSAFVKSIKMKNGTYTDLEPSLLDDVKIVNSQNIQHGNSCTLFALGTAEIIAQKDSFLDIRKEFIDTKVCRNFNIPTKFEEEVAIKMPQIFHLRNKIKDENGTGLVNKYFINNLQRRANLYKVHKNYLNTIENYKLKKLEKKFDKYKKESRKNEEKFYFRNKVKNDKQNNIQNLER